jgi:Tol biopolymer transport system component
VRTVLRRTDELTPRVIADSGMRSLVFSPDGKWLAFRDGVEVRRIRVDGGTSEFVTRGPLEILGGMAWIRGDTLVIGSSRGGLYAVPASGGTLRPWAATDSSFRRVAHPVALADGKTLLFWAGRGSKVPGVHALDLVTQEYALVRESPNDVPVGYVDGHVLMVSPFTTQLLAVPFDLRTRQVGGEGFPVAENVSGGPVSGPRVALSWSGTLLQLVDRTRQRVVRASEINPVQELLPPISDVYWSPRISPDGRQLAHDVNGRIHILDFANGTNRVLTDGYRPEWTEDGRRIIHLASRGRAIVATEVDGTGSDTIYVPSIVVNEAQMLPDGSGLLYRTAVESIARSDIFFLPLEPRGEPVPLVTGPAQDNMMRIAPSGRWVAYQSDMSGRFEIHVSPAPRPGPWTPITSDGGTEPSWSTTGRDLYYQLGGSIMRVPVLDDNRVVIGRAQKLLDMPDYAPQSSVRNYDVAPDGRSVVYVQLLPGESEAIIVHHWVRELRRRLAERTAP